MTDSRFAKSLLLFFWNPFLYCGFLVWYTGFRTKNTITIKQEVRNMKKRLLSMLLAAVMTVSIAGCSGSGTSSDSSSSGDNYTKEVKIDNVTLYLPEDAVETDESTDNKKLYDTSFGNIYLNSSTSAMDDWHSTDIIEHWKNSSISAKNFKQIMIGNEKALSFECESGDENKPSISLSFNTCSAHSLSILIICNDSIQRANEEYEKLLKHISIDNSMPTQTTTTTATTPSANDEFNKIITIIITGIQKQNILSSLLRLPDHIQTDGMSMQTVRNLTGYLNSLKREILKEI